MMASRTRSSSSMRIVLIQVMIGFLLSWKWIRSLACARRCFLRWSCLRRRGFLSRWSCTQRHRFVFMDGLPLVVVFRMQLPVGAGEGLRGFIRFEAQIAVAVLIRARLIAQSRVAEHQVVICLQVL